MENKPLSPTAGNPVSSAPERRLSLKKVLFSAGLVAIAAGFFLLTRVDPSGQNWAAVVSPFCIIGGYISIIIALLLKV